MTIVELILSTTIDKLAAKHSVTASDIRGRLIDGDAKLKAQFDTLIEIGRRVAVCHMFRVDTDALAASK